MAHRVDAEGEVDVFFRGVEDVFAAGDAGVVDEDRGVAEGGADSRRGFCNGFGRAEVAFEEADGWRS